MSIFHTSLLQRLTLRVSLSQVNILASLVNIIPFLRILLVYPKGQIFLFFYVFGTLAYYDCFPAEKKGFSVRGIFPPKYIYFPTHFGSLAYCTKSCRNFGFRI